MSIRRAIERYIEATARSAVFPIYEKEFATRIVAALSGGYNRGSPEPKLVEIIEDVVNSVDDLVIADPQNQMALSTRSIFIHGNRSHVAFDYYGQPTLRELGDLIFIISLVCDGEKHLEKVTINQFKRDSSKSGNQARWGVQNNDSGREQLYLLSRFPPFRGASSSIIPRTEYVLPNLSGCLGSYGLLYRPGDFAFIGATELEPRVGAGGTVGMRDLSQLTSAVPLWSCVPWFHPGVDEDFYLMHSLHRHSRLTSCSLWSLFGNHHHARNAFDFAHKYLTFGIGESMFVKSGIDNRQARQWLHEVLSAVSIKASRQGLSKLSDFVDDFFERVYSGDEARRGPVQDVEFDLDGGGIGIIHTTVNLGE